MSEAKGIIVVLYIIIVIDGYNFDLNLSNKSKLIFKLMLGLSFIIKIGLPIQL